MINIFSLSGWLKTQMTLNFKSYNTYITIRNIISEVLNKNNQFVYLGQDISYTQTTDIVFFLKP